MFLRPESHAIWELGSQTKKGGKIEESRGATGEKRGSFRLASNPLRSMSDQQRPAAERAVVTVLYAAIGREITLEFPF